QLFSLFSLFRIIRYWRGAAESGGRDTFKKLLFFHMVPNAAPLFIFFPAHTNSSSGTILLLRATPPYPFGSGRVRHKNLSERRCRAKARVYALSLRLTSCPQVLHSPTRMSIRGTMPKSTGRTHASILRMRSDLRFAGLRRFIRLSLPPRVQPFPRLPDL